MLLSLGLNLGSGRCNDSGLGQITPQPQVKESLVTVTRTQDGQQDAALQRSRLEVGCCLVSLSSVCSASTQSARTGQKVALSSPLPRQGVCQDGQQRAVSSWGAFFPWPLPNRSCILLPQARPFSESTSPPQESSFDSNFVFLGDNH